MRLLLKKFYSQVKRKCDKKIILNDFGLVLSVIKYMKCILYEIIEYKEEPIYESDEMLKTHAYTLARLSPYHCEPNTINFMLSLIKKGD